MDDRSLRRERIFIPMSLAIFLGLMLFCQRFIFDFGTWSWLIGLHVAMALSTIAIFVFIFYLSDQAGHEDYDDDRLSIKHIIFVLLAVASLVIPYVVSLFFIYAAIQDVYFTQRYTVSIKA